jgi:hypothetical protein
MRLWWLRLLRLLVYWGTRSRLELELLRWRSLVMHPSLRCPVALMFCQQARQEAGVQLWRVTIIDRNLRRPYRADQTLDHLVDLCLESGGDESRAFFL